MKCAKCNADIEQDAQFCPYCGNAVNHGRQCVKCGEHLDDDSDFCPYCGTKQSDTTTELESEEMKEAPQLQEAKNSQNIVAEEPSIQETHTQNVDNDLVDTIPYENDNGSKKWIFIIVAVLLLGILGGGGYYIMSNRNESPIIIQETDSIAEIDSIEPTTSATAKEFLERMYQDYYKQEEEVFLNKYFTKEAMQKLYVESDYDEDYHFYCTSFLTNGAITGGDTPDYGNKVVSRTIEPEGDDWYLVTNIWDVIKKPVKIHLQVKSVDGTLKIVDIRENTTDEIEDSERESPISIKELRRVSSDKALPQQGFSHTTYSVREGYETDIWYKNCEIDKDRKIHSGNKNSCVVEVFDGMNASLRITTFDKAQFESIKEQVLEYSVKTDNDYYFKWKDNEKTRLPISMGESDYFEGGYYIDIPLD